jgi:hypothetical protein
MTSFLVAVGLLVLVQLSPGEEAYISTECKLPEGRDCKTFIWQLEIAGVPLTTGDFTKEECQALRDELIPGLVVAGIKEQPICVAYAVQRDPT